MTKVLTQEQIANYRGAGYIEPISIFTPSEVAAMRTQLEAFEAEQGLVFSEDRPSEGDRFQGSYRFKSHLLFKWLAQAIRHPRILDAMEDLIGPDILCWTTHWFIKEAHSPNYVSWHQDSNYWGLDTDHLVSVWLALSPATVASGCLRLLPGSHTKPALAHVDTYAENNMLTRGQAIQNVDEAKAVNLEVQPGEVAIFDYRLAHASHPNSSDERRIGIGVRYIPPSARQVRNDWDCASLLRGHDPRGHFELEPEPSRDFDPPAVALHRKADAAQRAVYYSTAES
ncbi:MAG: non-heme Fe2+,alpha-ketoglutarate-dependent halogenase [Gammaproteobacteria bacterium]|jgi:non-heme Fe2+,alpha-ketoglutarate-dependent halogenase